MFLLFDYCFNDVICWHSSFLKVTVKCMFMNHAVGV